MTQSLIRGIRENDHGSISKAISIIENDQIESKLILADLYPNSNNAMRIGITGPPGAGKSTLTNTIIEKILEEDKTVGVIAVDPSSPFSGGALLGDRIRMNKYAWDSRVFLRSMGSHGDLGGLSLRTQEVGDIIAASGKDYIIFETVGVGQAEHDIVNAADYTAVVLVPESGDEVQLMKAGIIEIADIFIINKSDRPGSKRIERTLTDVLHSFSKEGSHIPEVMHVTASIGKGVKELFTKIIDDIDLFEKNGNLKKRRLNRYENRIKSLISERLDNEFWIKEREDLFKNITGSTHSLDTPPNSVVKQLISNFKIK